MAEVGSSSSRGKRIGRYAFVVSVALLCGLIAYGLTVLSLYEVETVAGEPPTLTEPEYDAGPEPGVLETMQNASVLVNSIAATLGTAVTAVVSIITLRRTRPSPAPTSTQDHPPAVISASEPRTLVRRQSRAPHRRPPSRP